MQSAKAQVKCMKAIIRRDANATETILTDDNKMCAIGGLAHYGARVSLSTMRRWVKAGDGTTVAWGVVVSRFPILAGCRASEVFNINDSYNNHDLHRRRVALCAFFDSLLDE